jgi:hypothetical protein
MADLPCRWPRLHRARRTATTDRAQTGCPDQLCPRNGEFLAKGEVFHEVAPQLIFMAYLQRVVNGGGFVDREYGIGAGRTDILVRKPWTGRDGKPVLQFEAIELKVRTGKTGDPLREGLVQIDGYLSRCGLDAG